MMRTLKYMAALAAVALAAALAACSTDPTQEGEQADPNPLLPQSDFPICWEVKDVASPGDATRSLIGNPLTNEDIADPGNTYTADNYYSLDNPNNRNYFLPISEACRTDLRTDPLKEKGFAVGLFGDYSYEENGKTVTVNNLYRGARLVYLPEVVVNDKVLSQWDTNVAMRYWHPGAKYIFRAYYPQRLHGYTISSSTATTVAMTYPSRKLQYDLLLGCAEVDTKADPSVMQRAVSVQMNHALAALRFAFKLNFEDADFLTSVYLANDSTQTFFTQGTVTYGGEDDIHSVTWRPDYNPPAREILYKWVPPLKYWYGIDKNNDGEIKNVEKNGETVIEEDLLTSEMLKYWGVDGRTIDQEKAMSNPILMYSSPHTISPLPGDDPSVVDEGNILYTGKSARAYYGMENHFDNETKTWVNDPADDVAVEGALYCRNSGWLLIPPQESFGKLTLCFTTKRGREAVYRATLPLETYTLIGSDGKLLKDADGHLITDIALSPDPKAHYAWVAGMRYTYLVTLSQTGYDMEITIDPWNERKHSTEIIF